MKAICILKTEVKSCFSDGAHVYFVGEQRDTIGGVLILAVAILCIDVEYVWHK